MAKTSKRFWEWFRPGTKNHFGKQDRIECPKCECSMYVVRRMFGTTHGELQTLECLNCRYTQTRTVGGDGISLK
jgi:hypothetical protein